MQKVNDNSNEIKRKERKSDFKFYIVATIITAVLILMITLSQVFFMGVSVRQTSMLPTLEPNDLLIVNKHKKAEVGSVIVISGETDDMIIKRVIATDGDIVSFNEDGFVYINGEKYVDEFGPAFYLDRLSAPFLEKTLGDGEIFYLGDNRTNSRDGRDYGTCESEQVVGVVEDWSIKTKILNKLLFWI